VAAHFSKAPVVRTFETTPERVFPAATAALKEMNYTIRRSRVREGLIEATGRIDQGSSLHSARQFLLQIQIEALPDGTTRVQVEARELFEEENTSGEVRHSERIVPEGSPHLRFFEELKRHL
jgi:hypothetical protein